MRTVGALILVMWAASDSPETAFHVSPAGNDAWSGTLAEPNAAKTDGPFATPARARDAARAAIRAGLKADLAIRLRGGVYRLAEPLVLGPEDSGTGAHAVVWSAAPGEKPVISGGRPVTGWKKAEGGLWTAEVAGTFRQLFVGGERRPRARAPDEGYFRIVKAGADDRTRFTFAPGNIRPWKRLNDVEVVFLHDWSISRIAIDSVNEAENVVTFRHPIGCDAKHYRISGFEKTPRYFVENALELLDRPGEWYLDRGAGRLYYRPLPGEDPERLEAVVPLAKGLLEVRGEAGRPVRNVRFSGISFEHAEWPTPEMGYAEGQASVYELRREGQKPAGRTPVPAAVRFEHAVSCALEGCRFAHLGGSGLWLAAGCHRNRISGCEVADVAANGVMIGEGYAATRKDPSGKMAGEADPELVAKGNVLTNSLVHRCGALYFGAVGVWLGITDGTVVSRNEIRDHPYTGVSLGWIWNPTPSPARENRVEGNHIHRCMQILSDGGGIYTLGRQPGTVLGRNLIHDIPVNAGRAESNGIFMDEGSTDILVEGNVIHGIGRAPIRFHKAGQNTIRRNVLVPPPGREPFTFNACKKETMVYDGNETPDPSSWKPPSPGSLKAGRE